MGPGWNCGLTDFSEGKKTGVVFKGLDRGLTGPWGHEETRTDFEGLDEIFFSSKSRLFLQRFKSAISPKKGDNQRLKRQGT
ncbi:hypothetical protein QL285_068521 [Trifolium repens]|jgi:hypothetical protein|nr:hypothetical protein QL285_068521 [Trifolium repens]